MTTSAMSVPPTSEATTTSMTARGTSETAKK
jgi:hypothetical protein